MGAPRYKTRMALNSKNEVNTVSMPKMTVRDHGIIQLGKQGENEVLQVIWRGIVPEWEEKYGAGEFQLAVRRNQDTAPYIANIELDGGDIVWTITSAETAQVGDGECELTYTVGDSIAKSQIWTITVCESLTGQEPVDPPEPAKNWVDVVIKSSSDAKQSATDSAESARQSAESSTNAANSANEAHKSREAIENMEVSAVSLSPDSDATVEKSKVDDKVKLTFGIPKGEKGESDVFWINAIMRVNEDGDEEAVDRTADEIISAYKAGKIMRLKGAFQDDGTSYLIDFSCSMIQYTEHSDGDRYMQLYFSRTTPGLDSDASLSGAYIFIQNDKVGVFVGDAEIGLLTKQLPVESKLHGAAREDEYGLDSYVTYYDHVHPAPFPNWTSSIGKALFVNNDNETPSQAFEWRDVPNGDFTSKVGDFLRVAEVDSNNKPTKWATDSIGGTKEPMIVTFTLIGVNPYLLKADIPYDDIKEAADAGRIVYAFVPNPGPVFGQLTNASASTLRFNAINLTGQIMNITMKSDSNIVGTFVDMLYRSSDVDGGGDFNAYNHRIKNVEEPTESSDVATKNYVDQSLGASDPSLGITSATVGQFLKVAEVDTQGKPTKWTTDSIANAKGVNF